MREIRKIRTPRKIRIPTIIFYKWRLSSHSAPDCEVANLHTDVACYRKALTDRGCPEFHSIAGEGGFVVFESRASNLVLGDTNGLQDVFVNRLMLGLIFRDRFE